MEKGSAMIHRSGLPFPTIDNANACVSNAARMHKTNERARPIGKCLIASAVTSLPVNTHGMTNIILTPATKKGDSRTAPRLLHSM